MLPRAYTETSCTPVSSASMLDHARTASASGARHGSETGAASLTTWPRLSSCCSRPCGSTAPRESAASRVGLSVSGGGGRMDGRLSLNLLPFTSRNRAPLAAVTWCGKEWEISFLVLWCRAVVLQISLTWCGKEREIWNTRPHDTRVPVSTQGATLLRSVRPRGSK